MLKEEISVSTSFGNFCWTTSKWSNWTFNTITRKNLSWWLLSSLLSLLC